MLCQYFSSSSSMVVWLSSHHGIIICLNIIKVCLWWYHGFNFLSYFTFLDRMKRLQENFSKLFINIAVFKIEICETEHVAKFIFNSVQNLTCGQIVFQVVLALERHLNDWEGHRIGSNMRILLNLHWTDSSESEFLDCQGSILLLNSIFYNFFRRSENRQSL